MLSRSRCEEFLMVGVNESQTVTPTGGNEDDLLLGCVVFNYIAL